MRMPRTTYRGAQFGSTGRGQQEANFILLESEVSTFKDETVDRPTRADKLVCARNGQETTQMNEPTLLRKVYP